MSASPNESQLTVKKDSRKLIYGILTTILLATWGYIIYDKSTTKEAISEKEKQIIFVSSEKDSIQLAFNAASAKLDELTSNNTKLNGDLAAKNDNIQKLKQEISAVLSKKNASAAELNKAKEQITELNGKIDGLFAEVEKLKGENKLLADKNSTLTHERDSLFSDKSNLQSNLSSLQNDKKNVENLASTLHASKISLTGIVKKGDGKEKETTTAKNVDILRINFDLDPNVLSPTGSKDLFICIVGLDGKTITKTPTDSIFKSRDGGIMSFTTKITVDYEQGKKLPVKFDWKNPDGFKVGNYKIEIYNNGFKIGEGTKELKKGGLFG